MLPMTIAVSEIGGAILMRSVYLGLPGVARDWMGAFLRVWPPSVSDGVWERNSLVSENNTLTVL